MKKLQWPDIEVYEPCSRWQEERFNRVFPDGATILEILKADIINQDKIWVFSRKGIVPERIQRLFAVRIARTVQHLMTDQRSIDALDVSERHANGEATDEELRIAKDGSREAAMGLSGVAWAAADAARATAIAAAAVVWDAIWDAAGMTVAWQAFIPIAIELIGENE